MIEPKPGRPLACGGRRLPAARMRARASLLALVLALAPGAANAQALRGSLDPLPGADPDMAPYALGPAPDTAFRPGPDTRIETSQDLRFETDPDTELDPVPVEPELPPAATPPELPEPPVVPRRRRVVEEDPYSQLGIRAGAFLVRPSVELYGGYDSNPDSRPDPEGSGSARGEAQLDVESDWSRHAFRGRLQAGYRTYDALPDLDAPYYAADAALRLDARHDLRVDLALRGALDSETRSDSELSDLSGRRNNIRTGAGAGVAYKPNRISLGLNGEVDRRVFEDEDVEDRNYTAYEVGLRTGYELRPGLEPFVEVTGNERIYDLPVNSIGIRHDSFGYRAFAGARIEPNPIWAVEGKIGYGHQEAEEDDLPVLTGLVAQGSLVWVPSALTTIRFTAEKDFAPTTVECCAIMEQWRTEVSFEHEFRRWLVLTGKLGYEDVFYEDIDLTERRMDAELGLEYKFNRTVSAKGRIAYERLDSTQSDEDYDATLVEVGVRVQR